MKIFIEIKDNKLTITNFLHSFKDKISLIVNSGIMIGLLCYVYLQKSTIYLIISFI